MGRTDHAHSTFTSTTITQKDGDDKKVMEAASGVISLFGNDVEKAVFSSTGSLFRGDNPKHIHKSGFGLWINNR